MNILSEKLRRSPKLKRGFSAVYKRNEYHFLKIKAIKQLVDVLKVVSKK